MNLTPNEVESIEDIGELNGSKVKLLRTRGGFIMALGRKKGDASETCLGAGSHRAIVKYNLEKQFPDFHPSMEKSELASDSSTVDKHSHFLSDTLRKSGHDIYSIQNGNEIEFQVTKDNVKVSSVNASLTNSNLIIGDIKLGKEFTRALSGATAEKALEIGVTKIRIQGK